MKLVKEFLNEFERGVEPKQALGIGIHKKLNPYLFNNINIPAKVNYKERLDPLILNFGDYSNIYFLSSAKINSPLNPIIIKAIKTTTDAIKSPITYGILYKTTIGIIIFVSDMFKSYYFGNFEAAKNLKIWEYNELDKI